MLVYNQNQQWNSNRRIFKLKPDYPAFWISGSRGAGKSATGERICEWYFQHGYVVLDWWASIDLENLAWCLPGKLDKDRKDDPTARSKGYPVLIIHPADTAVTPRSPLCRCGMALSAHGPETKCQRPSPLIRTIPDDTPLKDIIRIANRGRRICIFNKGLYQDERDAYRVMARYLRELPSLIVQGVIPSNISMVLFLRELGNIAPSGLHNVAGGYETQTKRAIQGLIREARHLRIVMIGDFQRSGDIAKSIASQRDFILCKRSTRDLIPDEYQWLYDAIYNKKYLAKYNLDYETYYNMPTLSELRPWQSYCVYPDNYWRLISLQQAGFKHKRPDDHWPDLANCEVRYLSQEQARSSGTSERARATLQREAEAKAKLAKLRLATVYRREGKSWEWICVELQWTSVEACQKAYNRARRRGLLDSEHLQSSNANAVVGPVD